MALAIIADKRLQSCGEFLIEAGKGIIAEFALKNSCMHITAAVDFDMALSSNRNKRLEAQAKNLVFFSRERPFRSGDKDLYHCRRQ